MDDQYFIYIRDLVIDMEMRSMSVASYRSIFDQIYYVSWYQKQFDESITLQEKASARFSLKIACKKLEHIMQVLDFGDSLKEKIRYIAKSPLSSVKL